VTTVLIGMVLVVVVALVVISVFSEDDHEDDRATRPRHVAPESSIDDLLG
jgi:hypothetical protein